MFNWGRIDSLISGMSLVWSIVVILLLDIYKETLWSYTWMLLILGMNGCLLVSLSLIKMYITGRMVDDEWLKIWIREYVCLILSLIDMNIEASYQTWAMMKWEFLNEVIQ